MHTFILLLLTALGPASWGSTYIVTSEYLPEGMPFTAAVIRCLPAGLLLIAFSRYLPQRAEWPRLIVLSALNIGCFQALLFVAAYRLPGGLAAVIGAIQPLILLLLVWLLQKQPPKWLALSACITAIIGMALLILTPDSQTPFRAFAFDWDFIGITAASVGAISMALGVYFSKYWQAPENQKPMALMALTGWQLTLGGLMLLPLSLLLEPSMPKLEVANLLGYGYLSIFGTLIAYLLWFRGIQQLPPVLVSSLGLLSPLTAVTLGWLFLDQIIEGWALFGFLLVIFSILVVQLSPYLTRPNQQKKPLQPSDLFD